MECAFNKPTATSSSHSPAADSQSCSTSIGDQFANLPAGFSFIDFEILHHFTVSTCFTLSSEPLVRNTLRVTLPQIGFANDYVLHAILSVAALHLSHCKTENSAFYISHAMQHHRIASATAVPLLTKISAENCVPICMFSALTFIFALASPRQPEDFLVVNSSTVPIWLLLLKGVYGVIQAESETISSSPLVALFQHNLQEENFLRSLPVDINESFIELENNIDIYNRSYPIRCRTLREAVSKLKRSYILVYGEDRPSSNAIRCVFTWLYHTSDDFLKLLKETDQEALCILGYFCVLLKQQENSWWIEGWATYLVSKIYSQLDELHRLWIRWPIEQIGWVP